MTNPTTVVAVADHYSRVASKVTVRGELRGWEGVRRISNTCKSKLLELLVCEARMAGLQGEFVDAGSGRGGDVMKWEHAAQTGKFDRIQVTGIDVAEEAVNEASRRSSKSIQGFKWVVGNIADRAIIPSCSGIACHFCLNYLNPVELSAFAKSAGSALRYGGLITAIFMDAGRLDMAPIGVVCRVGDTSYRWEMRPWVDSVEHMLSAGEVASVFSKHGLARVCHWEGLQEACSPDDDTLGALARSRPALVQDATPAEQAIASCYSVMVFRKIVPT